MIKDRPKYILMIIGPSGDAYIGILRSDGFYRNLSRGSLADMKEVYQALCDKEDLKALGDV
jgi:hypothetical protein